MRPPVCQRHQHPDQQGLFSEQYYTKSAVLSKSVQFHTDSFEAKLKEICRRQMRFLGSSSPKKRLQLAAGARGL